MNISKNFLTVIFYEMNDAQNLRKWFQAFDFLGTGRIPLKDTIKIMRLMLVTLDNKAITKIASRITEDGLFNFQQIKEIHEEACNWKSQADPAAMLKAIDSLCASLNPSACVAITRLKLISTGSGLHTEDTENLFPCGDSFDHSFVVQRMINLS
jgi:hypothetical protein